MTVYPFTSHAAVHSGIARVTLAGELDWDTGSHVREAVAACLAKQPTTLCLDLSGISFCDCAGLSALLRARMSVLRAGVGLVVEGIGAQLAELLCLIGADGILTDDSTYTNPEPARCAPDPVAHRRGGAAAIAESPLRGLLG
ncbi:STAS domain-containing protein [Streptomyces sp. NPDC057302]|uniref:STAS domain-containing protein n=1 Tax=Streptomyces sp. NPDC057302 TaxID=3346094 RepID=UPI003631D14F